MNACIKYKKLREKINLKKFILKIDKINGLIKIYNRIKYLGLNDS